MATQQTVKRVIEPDAYAEDSTPSGASSVTDQFDLTFRGFDRGQVEAYLDHWGHQYWAMERERDAALLELEELRANPPVQLSPLSTMSLRLQQIVTGAEEEAALLRADAADEAQRIRDAAHEEAEAERAAAAAERGLATEDAQRIRSEAQERYDQATSEAHRRRTDAAAEADRLLSEVGAEAQALREAAAEERESIVGDARNELAELERQIAVRRETAEAEHQQLLDANEAVHKKRSAQLRDAITDLQREIERLTGEVEARKQQLAVPAAVLSPPPNRPTPYDLSAQAPAAADTQVFSDTPIYEARLAAGTPLGEEPTVTDALLRPSDLGAPAPSVRPEADPDADTGEQVSLRQLFRDAGIEDSYVIEHEPGEPR